MQENIVSNEFTELCASWMAKFHMSYKKGGVTIADAITNAAFRSVFLSRFINDPSVINMSLIYETLPWESLEREPSFIKMFNQDPAFLSEAIEVKEVLNKEFPEIGKFIGTATDRQVLIIASNIANALNAIYFSKIMKKGDADNTIHTTVEKAIRNGINEQAISFCISAIFGRISKDLHSELVENFNSAFPLEEKIKTSPN